MNKVNYFLAGGLDKDQIKDILENSIKVLTEIGVEIPHKGIQALLTDYRGIKVVNGKRVLFAPSLIEKFFNVSRINEINENLSYEDNEYKIKGAGYRSYVIDIETGKIRDATIKDLIELTKLEDSYRIQGFSPILPQDIPLPLQEIAIHKFCWENSRNIGGGILTTIPSANYVYEMSQVVGKPLYLELWVMSPLKIDPSNLDLILHFLDKKNVEIGVGTFAMAGATSPLSFPGAWVQAMAENIAGFIILKLISKESNVKLITEGGVHPFDFKYANIAAGSPEEILMRLIGIQLMRYLGYEPSTMITTMAKEPNPQAGAEKMASAIVFALNGIRNFYGAGALAWDEVFSGEQVVIDMEIFKYIQRVIGGFLFHSQNLSLKIIREIGPGGNYLMHSSTVENFRNINWMPEIFEHSMLNQWKNKGGESLREKVRKVARQRIKNHSFELNKSEKRELDKIYNKAIKELV